MKQARHSNKLIWAIILLWIALLAIFYWQREQASQAYQELQSLQQYAQRWQRLRQHMPASVARATPLKEVIQRSAEKQGITLLKLSEQPGNELEVSLTPLLYTQLVDWLATLQQKEGVNVQTLQLTAIAQSGKVSVDNLRLRRL